jgi:hypothetical protein
MLARQAALGRPRVLGAAEEHLAGDADAVARQAQVGDHIAHHLFGAAVGIALGVVEEVDAVVPGGGHQVAGLVARDLVTEGHPGAEGQGGNRQAGGAQATVLHANLLLRARIRAGIEPHSTCRRRPQALAVAGLIGTDGRAHAAFSCPGPCPALGFPFSRRPRGVTHMVEGLGRIGFGLFGLAVLIGITWLFSNNKRAVDWKLVATGITLQIAFAALVILVPGGRDVFDALGQGFVKVLSFVNEGSGFIFGSLMDTKNYGFIFAFQVLPTIIFFSALMGVMYHLNVMQAIVRVMAWAITKVMRVSGAETTSVCASVFIGQTEAPLTVRPYIAKMTQSELLTMMIGGMAHIAGGVLAAYVGMLGGGDPAQQAFYAKHLLAASIMAAPATWSWPSC